MGDKRSKGITIFAWIILVSSAVMLFPCLGNLSTLMYPHNTVGIRDYLLLIISISSIIAAVFLLKLKEWARITILVISAVIIINNILVSMSVILKNFSISIPLSSIMLMLTLISLAFEGGVIYYFTRPTVKGQFK